MSIFVISLYNLKFNANKIGDVKKSPNWGILGVCIIGTLEMNKKSIRKILGEFKKYVLGGVWIHGTDGTNLIQYCYIVWFRYLLIFYKNGFTKISDTIIKLNPVILLVLV